MKYLFPIRCLLVGALLLAGATAVPAAAQLIADETAPHTEHFVSEGDTVFTRIPDLAARGQALLDANEPGVHRTPIFSAADGTAMILFAMHEGVHFPEHAANRTALLQVVKGSGTITLGDEEVEAAPGTWIHLTPNLDHSLTAHTPFVFVVVAQPPRN